MSHACTPILVGVTSLVSEILLPSKTAKFPLLTMDYSPWSSKNSIVRNRLINFMQVGIDVKCMHMHRVHGEVGGSTGNPLQNLPSLAVRTANDNK